MKILRDESGQVLVLSVFCLPILLAFLALAVEVGLLFDAKRQLQTAADAAAIAGAAEINFGDFVSAAKTAATQNGFTNGTNGVTVQVNPSGTTVPSPASGAFAGQSGYLEVIISQVEPTYFMNFVNSIINLNFGTMTVSARSVAALGASQNCVYTLGTSGVDITVNGASQLNAPGCGILDNSSSSPAMSVSGSGMVTAGSVSVVGTAVTDNSGSKITPTAVNGVAPGSDPLAFLQPPSLASSSCVADPINGTFFAASAAKTVGPSSASGTVCYNGLNISNGATVTLTPGTYVINGTFTISGGATLNAGSGTTFYLPSTSTGTGYVNGSVDIAGGVTVTLVAPTSGTYNGILFYQDRSNPNTPTIAGGASATMKGILYFPDAQVNMSNGTGTNMFTPIIAKTLSITGGSTFQDNNYSGVNPSSPLSSPRLVE
jgi:hypothetical protein